MTYSILDSTGSTIAAFDDEVAARATLRAIVEAEPEAAEHLMIIVYDDAGMPVGDPILFEDIPPAVTVRESDLLIHVGVTVGQNGFDMRRYLTPPAWVPRPRTDVSTEARQPA